MTAQSILVSAGPSGAPALFAAPHQLIIAHRSEDVPTAFAAIRAAQAAGKWLAGYASYELGYCFEPRLASLLPENRRVPLMLFGVFDGPQDATATLAQAAALAPQAQLGIPQPDWGERGYASAFERLAEYIRAGDCYQVNLTMPLRCMGSGPALGLFGALAAVQPVHYGALVDLGVGPVVLSRSPELFFKCNAGGHIETHPMKGTRPRDADPARDAANADDLRFAVKDRAENLMIVDLMRNDLSRLCHPGTVNVPDLFAVETYATVHQMVSRVQGQLLPGTEFEDIMRALFPCGSITGAPKLRAMEIIRELEPGARDVYCGSIGWLAPDGAAEFNVAIRTISLYDGREVVLNVGGGVVADSTAESEYEEALWKARYARTAPLS